MAKQDGLVAAPAKLSERLKEVETLLETTVEKLVAESAGMKQGLIRGAADALDIPLGVDGWAYEREQNRFRRTDAKRPGDAGWPPELHPELELRPEAAV